MMHVVLTHLAEPFHHMHTPVLLLASPAACLLQDSATVNGMHWLIAPSNLLTCMCSSLLPWLLLPALQQDFPTDVDFKWAQDSYNVTQRNTDTWVFFAVFRARLWLLDQKWSYPGGFTGVWPCCERVHVTCCDSHTAD
jgi:hypothetical protein